MILTILKIKLHRVAENTSLKFPWAPVEEALNADIKEKGYASYTYLKPNGEPLSFIIGAEAERVNAGAASVPRRETSSRVCHIYAGKGFSEVTDMSGATTILKWKENDTFAIPSWNWVIHHAENNGNAYIFSYNDKPLLTNLNMYKSEQK